VTKLAELNVPLGTHEVGMTQDTQQPPLNGQQYLELTCNGLVCVGVLFCLGALWKFCVVCNVCAVWIEHRLASSGDVP
jgi:hypothetical protein